MLVHPSNFVVMGFTAGVGLKEVVEIGRRHQVHDVAEQGFGTVVAPIGLARGAAAAAQIGANHAPLAGQMKGEVMKIPAIARQPGQAQKRRSSAGARAVFANVKRAVVLGRNPALAKAARRGRALSYSRRHRRRRNLLDMFAHLPLAAAKAATVAPCAAPPLRRPRGLTTPRQGRAIARSKVHRRPRAAKGGAQYRRSAPSLSTVAQHTAAWADSCMICAALAPSQRAVSTSPGTPRARSRSRLGTDGF